MLKKLMSLISILIILFLSGVTIISAGENLSNADKDLGFKLFNEINKDNPNKNTCISPLSIALALQMTYNGAAGDTQKAMGEALEIKGMPLDKLNKEASLLIKDLKSTNGKVQLAIANSIWGRKDIKFSPDFEKICKDYYGAEVKSGLVLSDINNWVSKNTMTKIPKILDQISSDAVILLMNAIYFKGNWAYQFDKNKTQNGTFYLSNGKDKRCPMMFQAGKYNYYKGEKFQAISLPYSGERINMSLFLPTKDSSLKEFQENLNVDNWNKWLCNFKKTEGEITLPRFKMEYTIRLNEALKKLGMEDAFSVKANFEKMCKPAQQLIISEVKHKTYIEVNEEGTEAAATTAVIMTRNGGEHFSMNINRPFFFAIYDNKTGAILFMGTIFEP